MVKECIRSGADVLVAMGGGSHGTCMESSFLSTRFSALLFIHRGLETKS